MQRLAAVAMLAFLVAVAATGCGGGSDSASTTTTTDATQAWATDFCSAVTTWKTDLDTTTSQFTDASNLPQDNTRSAASDARDSPRPPVASIKGLGNPPTDPGQQV